MTDLMVGDNLLLIPRNTGILLLISGNNNLNTLLKVCLSGKLTSIADRTESCLIDNICKLRAGSAGSSLCNLIKADSICNFNFF